MTLSPGYPCPSCGWWLLPRQAGCAGCHMAAVVKTGAQK